MDRVKIGGFIATCRRKKNITQEDLAELFGITNKSISKWENGICLPDAALYEPLCNILDITINELFAGQHINDEDYKRIADENLMDMLKYRLYCMSDKTISFVEFDNALTQASLMATQLKAFHAKDEAVSFLVEETQEDFEVCSKAYDFYIGLFDKYNARGDIK